MAAPYSSPVAGQPRGILPFYTVKSGKIISRNAQKIWNRRKKLFSHRKPLISNKTAKEKFGKACKNKRKIWKNLAKSLDSQVFLPGQSAR